MNKKLVSKLAFIADKNVWLSVRLHLDCFPLEHLWLEFTTYTSISRFINYFTLLSNYHNDSKHSFLKINSLFIYIWNLHFGIYLNKNILINVRYKRQDTRPFYIPQFKLSRQDIPLFILLNLSAPEFKFYSWYTGAGAVFTAHVLLAR